MTIFSSFLIFVTVFKLHSRRKQDFLDQDTSLEKETRFFREQDFKKFIMIHSKLKPT